MITKTDLEAVNPSGRIDVLAYRGVKHLVTQLETNHGLSGIWDAIKPHVNDIAAKHIGAVDVPTEAKILLAILMSEPKKVEGK